MDQKRPLGYTDNNAKHNLLKNTQNNQSTANQRQYDQEYDSEITINIPRFFLIHFSDPHLYCARSPPINLGRLRK